MWIYCFELGREFSGAALCSSCAVFNINHKYFQWFLVITCPSLENPVYGKLSSLNQPPYGVGDRVYFRCERGFQLNQNYTYIACKETGSWNLSPPQCFGKNNKTYALSLCLSGQVCFGFEIVLVDNLFKH